MEQTISPTQAGMNPKTVKTLKIVAFTFFSIDLIYSLLMPVLNNWLINNGHIGFSNYLELPSFFAIAISWICLSIIAPNKPTRIASCAFGLVDFVFLALPPLHNEYAIIYVAVRVIALTYLLSIIFTNISFSPNERKWCSLLFLFSISGHILTLMHNIYNPYIWNVDFNGDGYLMNKWYSSQYRSSGSYQIYFYITRVFLVIAYYKLCFSKAFSGNYDASVKGKYTPLNRYFIGALLTIVVTCGLLCLIFFFRHDIMNLL